MIKSVVQRIKLLLLILIELVHRFQKLVKFFWYGKHEFERICETQMDIYGKTMQIDQWLSRTSCEPIRQFFKRHFDAKSSHTVSAPKRAINRVLKDYCSMKERMIRDLSQTAQSKDALGGGDLNRSRQVELEDGDIVLNSVLRGLMSELLEVITRAKKRRQLSAECKACLSDTLYRILSYKLSMMIAEQLASTKYDSDRLSHTDMLINLWNNLVQADKQSKDSCGPQLERVFPPELSHEVKNVDEILSNRWSHIGFQGEDPGTDFRGMGMLGLVQLSYLARRPRKLARDLLRRSLNEPHSYPFAIVGINITYNLLGLFRDGSMKHLYYDTGDALFRGRRRALNLLTTFNEIYVELFLRFDCLWHESKPETIFAFKELMEKFVSIVKLDLSNRHFSLKFIY